MNTYITQYDVDSRMPVTARGRDRLQSKLDVYATLLAEDAAGVRHLSDYGRSAFVTEYLDYRDRHNSVYLHYRERVADEDAA